MLNVEHKYGQDKHWKRYDDQCIPAPSAEIGWKLETFLNNVLSDSSQCLLCHSSLIDWLTVNNTEGTQLVPHAVHLHLEGEVFRCF